jgi:hypothetical protein
MSKVFKYGAPATLLIEPREMLSMSIPSNTACRCKPPASVMFCTLKNRERFREQQLMKIMIRIYDKIKGVRTRNPKG